MLKTQLWVPEHTKFRLNNKGSRWCKNLRCCIQFLRGSGIFFCIWLQLTVGFDYINCWHSFLEMRLKCECPGLEWGWVNQVSRNSFISKLFLHLLYLWTLSPRVQLWGNLTLVQLSWQMKGVHRLLQQHISRELQDPCSSALVWMSVSGSEQVSSNTPLAGFPEPVKANWRLKYLNKKMFWGWNFKSLESRKFTVSGDMTVHDEWVQEKTLGQSGHPLCSHTKLITYLMLWHCIIFTFSCKVNQDFLYLYAAVWWKALSRNPLLIKPC